LHFACRIIANLMALGLLAVPAAAQALAPDGPTLAAVRERGHLICGSADPIAGFAQLNADGRWVGFDVDMCRAVATAIFGNPDALEFRPLSGAARFADLQTGQLDLLVRDAAWTLGRDTRYGAIYAAPTFYDGQAFMVPAALGVVSAYQLDDLRVCVLDGDNLGRLLEFAFETQANFTEIIYEDRQDLSVAYQQGLCDAVSAAGSWLNALRRDLPDPSAQRILPERISKAVFGPVVRANDAQWLKIVRWTTFALINAEEAGVTSLNIESLTAAKTHRIRRLLGLEGSFGPPIGLRPDFMKNVITAVGNYGEIFDRNFGVGTGAGVSRGQNALWLNGGLIYAPNVE
jgi:general L-amino acid transport system substrate-binding protein